ncbi:hypothetical protein ABPG77_011317 [Micractinium sp. CCAP 211/92]
MPALAVSGGGGSGNSLAFSDLSGQDLRKNKYTKADLRGVDMSGSNLEGVTLLARWPPTPTDQRAAGAVKSIKGADFTDVVLRKDVQAGLCKIADGVNPSTGVATRDSLLCP